jgi:eukaryotic-like serine/threonine-protein kinase
MPLERLGRYELLGELSREIDGVVYKASDPLLDRLVAIKTIELGAAGVSRDIRELCFERKAKLAGALTHPNIVIVYDMGKSGDVAYIATELPDGQTLREILDSGVTLAPGTIERIAAQVADGLEFTHQHAVVHCDVSPSTIVVLNIGLVKISHLGNALFPMRSRTPEGTVGAASHYISPEQALGTSVDARSDIFSLGIVLYEMLAGVAPFSGSTADEVVDAVVNKNPPSPSSLNRNIPSGFDYVVARALSKDPNHRYQSARDMAFDLRKWALEEPTFFPTSRAYVTTVQTAPSRPADVAIPRGFAATGEVLNGASSEQTRENLASFRTRRQWLLYGVPGALLALSSGWTILSRRTPTREPSTESLASAIPDTPESGSLDLALRNEPLPAIVQTAVEPVRASTTEPASGPAQTRPVARLRFAVSPWGEIYIDGRRTGVSPPLRQIELAPGKYTIEIKNTIFPTRSQSVEVNANARLKIKHKFK